MDKEIEIQEEIQEVFTESTEIIVDDTVVIEQPIEFTEEISELTEKSSVDTQIDTFDYKSEYEKILNEYNQIKADFDTYKSEYSTPNTEVETLRNFQSERLEQDRKEAEAAIFSEFDEELADVDEYKAIKDNSSKYELETLKEKCFAILGKSKRTFSFSKKSEKSSVILGVDRVSTEDDPYGGLIKSVNK